APRLCGEGPRRRRTAVPGHPALAVGAPPAGLDRAPRRRLRLLRRRRHRDVPDDRLAGTVCHPPRPPAVPRASGRESCRARRTRRHRTRPGPAVVHPSRPVRRVELPRGAGRRGGHPLSRAPGRALRRDGPGPGGRREHPRRRCARRHRARPRSLPAGLRPPLTGGAATHRRRERRPHLRPPGRPGPLRQYRSPRRVGHPAPPLPRSCRDPRRRGAAPRAGDMARGGATQDPLLLAAHERGGAQEEGRPPRRALARPPPATCPRRPHRSHRLRGVSPAHRRRPRVRRHARGQGEGSGPAAPARATRGARPAPGAGPPEPRRGARDPEGPGRRGGGM
ncbi:MAG: UV damage repair endonuclease, partial [uncultured Solirubrobacteraceae bacterium]